MNNPQQSVWTIGLIRFFRFVGLGWCVLLGLHSLLADANFTVSGGQFGAPYFNFADGAGQTPDFTTEPLYRGATYQFSDSGVSGSHPFMIGESYGVTTSSLVSGGPLNGSGGTISVTIPSDFNGSLYYFCTNHGAMVQEFMIDEPNHMVELNSTVSLEMIWVEPGTFTMGSPVTESGRETDESEQDVSITRGFFLGKYPVSQSQYEAIMNGVTGDANSTPSLFSGFPNRPVERVSYNDAQIFIHRLNQKESENIPGGWAYALPTEAEWEYACRAGTTTPFSFGNSITTSDANYNANGFLETTDVGQYAANQWGFYDMAGNVWEWCNDWYGDYPGGSLTDPLGPSTGTNRVARGGSFVNNGDNQRSASRNYWIPDGRHKAHGFRLAYKIIPNSAPTGLSIASHSGGGQASLLKNIAYEGNSSYPAEFTEFNGEVYFNASDENGMELWKTDGTESGTVMLKDIHPGTDSWGDPASSYPYNFTVFDGALYFAADDGNGTELWKSDGTESGTVMVKDILLDDGFGGIGSSNPGDFTEFNGSLYFSAKDGNGTELWKTDGTASGTVIVKDIYPGSDNFGEPASSNPSGFTVFDGALYFRATDGNGTELWKSDGTASGTEMVKDILLDNGFGSAGSSEPTGLTVFDGALYFSATDGNGTELWKSDGTQSGTQLLKDVYPGEDGLGSVQSGNPTNFLEFDGSLYFTGTDGSGIELWKTDGTDSGTSIVKDIFLGVNEWGEPSSSYPANLTVFNDHLFFDAMDENGTELWKTDGTESGTTIFKNINAEENSSSPLDLQVLGDKLFFFADDGTHGYELWESDGTSAGTKLHLDINQGAGDSARLVLYYDPGLGQEVGWFEAPLYVAGGKLFFSADDGTNGHEPYMLSGSSSSSSGSQSIELSESVTVGSVVAQLSATDPEGDALSYSLISGEGDGNNSLFTLDENGTLTTSQVLDYDAGATLSIRVQARDEQNASVEGNFTISLVELIGTPPGRENHTADLNATVSMEMIWVEPGTFTMGSPENEAGRGSNETQHEVTLTKGFYLGKYEVTQAQYEAVMTGNTDSLSATPSQWPNNPDRPVDQVSHDDIQKFLARLNSQQAGNIPEGWAYVLPTEAQWEYACRAGTTTAYSWGDSITTDDANYNSNIGQTADVGQYSANPWGFFDMHGNVWEWTADWYAAYSSGAQTDPVGPASGSSRAYRGGRWISPGTYLRSASRANDTPSSRSYNLGFRVGFQQIPADVASPEMQILGDANITQLQGVAWVDPGVEAHDVRDGNLSGDVTFSGTVDVNTIGTYTLTYTVSDTAGNQASLTRTVNIVAGQASTHTADLNATVSMEMIWVDPGIFTMGQDGWAAPVHEVTLTSGFYLGKYEVTQAQYEAVMTGNTDGLNATPSSFAGNSDRPVENVSHDDIQKFLTRLNNQQTGNIPEGWAYVLPTEAQWEYACRAGMTTAYSWGDSINASDANYNSNVGQTENVGQYSANPWGFFDMHGNVWEWTVDWYDTYTSGAQNDPEGPASGSLRVTRGGSWYHSGTYLRSAYRNHSSPGYLNYGIGFRVGFQQQ